MKLAVVSESGAFLIEHDHLPRVGETVTLDGKVYRVDRVEHHVRVSEPRKAFTAEQPAESAKPPHLHCSLLNPAQEG